jgi:hypothetical protein
MAKPRKPKSRPEVRGQLLKGVNAHLKGLKRFPPKLPITSKTVPRIPGTKNL